MLYRSVILGALAVAGMTGFAAEPQHTGNGDREKESVSKTSPDKAATSQGGLAADNVSGACCLPGGTCQLVATEPDCQTLGGAFLGAESTCDNCPGACVVGVFNPPQCMGAVLVGPRCMDIAPDECAAEDGIFQGAGSTCASLMGACCFDAGCWNDVLQADCDTNGGRFQGIGSECPFGPPSLCSGACCVFGDRCFDALPACFCTELLGGTYQGDGTTCTDSTIDCTNPTGACCAMPLFGLPAPAAPPSGISAARLATEIKCSTSASFAQCCEGITEFMCFLLSGTYNGDDSSCEAASCTVAPCPGRGDCCVPHRSGGCADVACCDAVCRVEPQCCLGNGLVSLLGLSQPIWDGVCVATARRVCDPGVESCVSCPGLGDCCQANGSGGCTDERCCREVCAVDPYCCNAEWDTYCAASAAWSCGNACFSLGDFNGDGTVDLEDYSIFEILFTGP